MNADIIPTEIAVVILTELLFGFGYNQLVAYWTKHNLMHVSWAVVIGVAATLLIPALFWFDTNMPFYLTSLLLLACFAASGTPMIAGSMHRTVQEKENKKRRPLGNAAMRIRDEGLSHQTPGTDVGIHRSCTDHLRERSADRTEGHQRLEKHHDR